MTDRYSHTPADAEDFKVYKDKGDKHYSEKGGHQQRTLANDTRAKGHKDHFKKVEK